MFSHIFLAMTAAELAEYCPPKAAYMACHFSPYGKGLSNLPPPLPKGSILLLDDSTPVCGHDKIAVEEQLKDLVSQYAPEAILLDFQGVQTEENLEMAAHLVHTLPCPVAVTEKYAKKLKCPVFLSPTPITVPLQEHLGPWLKQGVYLEIAPASLQITVTEDGSTALSIPHPGKLPLQERKLHCHYNVESFPRKAVFTLSRTKEDLQAFVKLAEELGVCGTIGLYQELSGYL